MMRRLLRPLVWAGGRRLFVLFVLMGATLAGTTPVSASTCGMRVKAALAQLELLDAIVTDYAELTGEVPSNETGLAGALEALRSHGKRSTVGVRKRIPRDPWTSPFIYRPDTESPRGFRLYTTGIDTRDDQLTGDDFSLSIQPERRYYGDYYDCGERSTDRSTILLFAAALLALSGVWVLRRRLRG